MRSKALSFLLSLSLMFCVGFGSSLTASAAVSSPDAKNEWFLLPFDKLHLDTSSVVGQFDSNSGTYNATLRGSSYWPTWGCSDIGAVMPHFKSGNTYLIYYTFSFVNDSLSDDSDIFYLRRDYTDSGTSVRFSNISSSAYYVNSTTTVSGISKYSFISDYILSTSSSALLNFPSICSSSGRVSWAFYALDITDNTDSEVNQIVAAIQDQTSDLQQSIEDQYGGDPGSSFPVDDIITQHNEKMGVLSFSSDALMQVLGLLSPDQTLSSELVFPSMSLTIAGQRNRVQLWPEYRFDLNTLKQHWPDFVGLMQSLTTALVWIFVLRYCYRVFEKYFLAGGGN